MKKVNLLILLFIVYITVTNAQNPSIIPLPQQIQWDTIAYTVPVTDNTIAYNSGAEKAALWLGKLIQPFAKYIYAKDNDRSNWSVNLDASLAATLGDEGYILDITASGVKIKGATAAGLFYGIQTVRQLLPADIEKKIIQGTVTLKCVHIEDAPAYSWRGCMIDIARRFHSYEEIRQQIDRMALYKLNRLHLHLSDDQGWRIEIKSKPNLIAVGSKWAVGGGTSGFLTQKQYQDLQDYALERHIVIIPEIDMPGHIYAALASYPDLNCSNNSNINPAYATPPQPYTGVKVGWSKFCLTKPSIYDFVETVIGELAGITKGPWIHLGGDEIKDNLYGDFIRKAEAIVRKNSKTAIGWEEVLGQAVDPSTIGQLWQSNTGAANKTILSFCGSFYLDHGNVPGQPNAAVWCSDQGVSLERVYGFQFTSVHANAIGIEGAVWTENVEGIGELDNRLWPRMIAIAEVSWTQQTKRETGDFIKRLGYHGVRLSNMGCQYYVTPTVNWIKGTTSNPGSVYDNFTPNLDELNNIGIIEYDKLPKFKLFPNPANNTVYISEVMSRVDIYDFTGKLISQQANTNNFKVAHLLNGIYFVQTNKGAARFIVEH